MAEDLRDNDYKDGNLDLLRTALKKECQEQSNNTVYTSTSFYIWLRWLRIGRGLLWIVAVAASAIAASSILTDNEVPPLAIAALTLVGVLIPGIIKALNLDETIDAYSRQAGLFKNVEGALRRAAEVWSNKQFSDFEAEARAALTQLDDARRDSLTPPEWCFKRAQKKVQTGDYDPDPVE